MLTRRGRWIFSLIAIAFGLWGLSGGMWEGWLLFLVPPGMVLGYYRYGPMVVAWRAYLEKDWNGLERILGEVRKPEWLRPSDRAYYAFLSGESAFARGDYALALKRFDEIDGGNLRTDHGHCLLECRRAEAAFRTGDPVSASENLIKARLIPHRPEADEEIARVERMLRPI
ncbi:hypothetical protein GC170_09335 [bacterium]|nr:hypothetical protein [bacterium]